MTDSTFPHIVTDVLRQDVRASTRYTYAPGSSFTPDAGSYSSSTGWYRTPTASLQRYNEKTGNKKGGLIFTRK